MLRGGETGKATSYIKPLSYMYVCLSRVQCVGYDAVISQYNIHGCTARAAIHRLLRSLKQAHTTQCKSDRAEDVHDLVQWATFKCQQLKSGAGKAMPGLLVMCAEEANPYFQYQGTAYTTVAWW